MARYRRRPTPDVEANQFLDPADLPPGVQPADATHQMPFVTTADGQEFYLRRGDWAVRESDGVHYYPASDKIFRASWEPV